PNIRPGQGQFTGILAPRQVRRPPTKSWSPAPSVIWSSARASTPSLVAALRRAAPERGGPLPSIAVADALLDERRMLMGDLTYRQMMSGEYGRPGAVFVL